MTLFFFYVGCHDCAVGVSQRGIQENMNMHNELTIALHCWKLKKMDGVEKVLCMVWSNKVVFKNTDVYDAYYVCPYWSGYTYVIIHK